MKGAVMADIFDKLVDGLSKGVATVGANSRAMLEKGRITNIIKNLEDERKQYAEFIGMKVYEMCLSDSVIVKEEIADFVPEITRRLQLIAEQREHLKRIDMELNMVTGGHSPLCRCGNMNVQGAKFCAKCGNAL
jgi:DNA gyrase/topoisomerase IV subunit A